jgi:2-keto-4-pentenoate hydratase/2-oxohepta-3-ene-1,7-dioic acid hydratase in catechol pathway
MERRRSRTSPRIRGSTSSPRRARSAQLVHDFSELLVYLSSHITLQPGDVILTGTPAGVGFPTGTFLKPGDTVRIEVEGCGVLENPVVAGD